jgi:hypothetical protein
MRLSAYHKTPKQLLVGVPPKSVIRPRKLISLTSFDRQGAHLTSCKILRRIDHVVNEKIHAEEKVALFTGMVRHVSKWRSVNTLTNVFFTTTLAPWFSQPGILEKYSRCLN